MAGAPSHLDLFDLKPKLQELHGRDCPESLLRGERFAFIQGVPKILGFSLFVRKARPVGGRDVRASARHRFDRR